MKKFYLVMLLAGTCTQIIAQGVTQSADGASTVLMNGSGLSLDAGKTDLTFGWNNLNKPIVTHNNGVLVGGNIKVKNATGLGNLFSKGDLVPEGKGTAYIGGYFSNALADDAGQTMNALYIARRTELLNTAVTLFKDTLDMEVSSLAEQFIAAPVTRGAAVAAVNAFYSALPVTEKLFFVARFDPSDPDNNTRLFRTALKDRMKDVKAAVEIPYRTLSRARFELENLRYKLYKSQYRRFLFYFFGGIDAMSFKRFNAIDSSNLKNSFVDENFRGGHFGAGINFEYWRFRFGVTYSYINTNNFSTLAATEYTLQSSTVISGQTLQSKDVITAYSGGKYGSVERNEFNVDLIYNCRIADSSHILINPYIRANIYSRDTSLLKNKTNIGVGGYFFKNSGKFMGGLYVELPDVNNNAEKAKPEDKQNLLPPLKRLSFGIVVKLSLLSLFSW